MEEDDEDDDNIEVSIQKEIEALNAKESKSGKEKLFSSIRVDISCVLFFKTRKPVEPVEFVKRICEDAMGGAPRRSRFVNRLTPMVMMGKATEKGLEEVGRAVLGEVFGVAGEDEEKNGGEVGVTVSKFLLLPFSRQQDAYHFLFLDSTDEPTQISMRFDQPSAPATR